MTMDEDKHLKALLSTAAPEKASPAFTSNIMNSIKRVQATKYIHQPLVPTAWIRVYKIAFAIVISLLLMVSLIIELSALSYEIHLPMPAIVMKYSNTVLMYIVAFWSLTWLMHKLNRKTKNILHHHQ
jgi:hypothetical protein